MSNFTSRQALVFCETIYVMGAISRTGASQVVHARTSTSTLVSSHWDQRIVRTDACLHVVTSKRYRLNSSYYYFYYERFHGPRESPKTRSLIKTNKNINNSNDYKTMKEPVSARRQSPSSCYRCKQLSAPEKRLSRYTRCRI